jgi:hypothetical protein
MMLYAATDAITGQTRINYWKYDSTGRPILAAEPSAVNGYSDTYADLMDFSLGVSPYLNDTTGLIQTKAYGSSTTATSSTPGDVQTYLKEVDLEQGELGTVVPQETFTYTANTDSNGITIYPVASDTQGNRT